MCKARTFTLAVALAAVLAALAGGRLAVAGTPSANLTGKWDGTLRALGGGTLDFHLDVTGQRGQTFVGQIPPVPLRGTVAGVDVIASTAAEVTGAKGSLTT